MSRDPVEIVRRGLDLLSESYERGSATNGLLDLCAPDIRVDASRRVFNPEVYEGRAGVERSILDTYEAWGDFHFTNERSIDAGERVAVIQTIAGRGRASKAEVELKGAMIWTVRGGLINLIEVFMDPREALQAIGLEED
jgi:ketosteroid isomerase-like protein